MSTPLKTIHLDCHILNRLSFWDGLMVEAAAVAGCAVMLSEDLTDGQDTGS